MSGISLQFLTEQIELSQQLRAGRASLLQPQDLPGAFGPAIKAIDHVLGAMNCESVMAGGWAVWYYGFAERLTQDIDIVVAADRIEEFLRVAAVSGFEVLSPQRGRWPKIRHRETGIKVDILPEGARPGTASHPAPTTIPAPAAMGASGSKLRYAKLESLVELKIAAGREKDKADIVMILTRLTPKQISATRKHLAGVHADYAILFDRLLKEAEEQRDEN